MKAPLLCFFGLLLAAAVMAEGETSSSTPAPASSTPASSTPAPTSSTPASSTPASSTPASSTPSVVPSHSGAASLFLAPLAALVMAFVLFF